VAKKTFISVPSMENNPCLPCHPWQKKSATSMHRKAASQIIRGKRKNTLPQSIFYFVFQLTFRDFCITQFGSFVGNDILNESLVFITIWRQ
jgi:hypothetical protein